MGLGELKNGRHQPITPYKGSWAEDMARKAGRTLVSSERLWAANANGRYGWTVKNTYSDGSVEWRDPL